MKKRFLALGGILVLVLSFGLLAGCAGGEGDIHPTWAYDSLNSENSSMTEGANLRVMTYNVLVDAWGGDKKAHSNIDTPIRSRAEQVSKMLEHYQPDVVGLQELGSKWHKYLPKVLSENYALVFPKSGEYTSMLYNTDTLDLIESGKQKFTQRSESKMRYVAWALFERKSDSKQFIVLNTHFDFGKNADKQASQMKEFNDLAVELRAKYNVPVFLTGDYNACERATVEGDYFYDGTPGDSFYREFASYTPFVDSIDMSSVHTDGKNMKWSEPKWDHIFVSQDVEVKSYNVLSNDYYTTISDHFPIYIDVAI